MRVTSSTTTDDVHAQFEAMFDDVRGVRVMEDGKGILSPGRRFRVRGRVFGTDRATISSAFAAHSAGGLNLISVKEVEVLDIRDAFDVVGEVDRPGSFGEYVSTLVVVLVVAFVGLVLLGEIIDPR